MNKLQIETLRDGIEAEAQSCGYKVTAFEVFDDTRVVIQLEIDYAWEE